MRIIAGKYKSRRLEYPKTRDVRPTMDKVKESMFNMLGRDIEDAKVLSIFSGSGSLGFEALSRGARHVTFVDLNPESIRVIEHNKKSLGIADQESVIIKANAFSYIEILARKGERFDYIFIDPPYYQDLIKKTLMKLEGFDILAPISYLVIEHAKDEPIPASNVFNIINNKKFGATLVTICQKVEA
ncbi:MAG: 16S rRNA (guanine(966)-N(2))-methyltransferase RsmD [Candidatus Omnitrophica bacterium]|nr:16S rRNA (guanine(966)-N(2))-methyltransferase RsmD [Candidatus Omnitrophota bacterium]